MNAPMAVRIAEVLDHVPSPILSVVDLLLKVTLLLVLALILDLGLRRRAPLAAVTLWNALLAAVVCLPAAQYLLPRTEIVGVWLPPSLDSQAGDANIAEPWLAAATEVDRRSAAAADDSVIVSAAPPPPVPSGAQDALLAASLSPSAAPAFPATEPASAMSGGMVASGDTPPTIATVPVVPSTARSGADSPRRVPHSFDGEFARYVVGGSCCVYGFGFVVVACRLAGALRAVGRLRRTSTLTADADWRRRFDRWVRRLELDPARIELRTSDAVSVPLVVGWRRPAVIIPCEVAIGASPVARDAVLVHELAHAARGDYAWQLLLRALQAVLWFHPLIWHAERRIHFVRERVCDAFSVYGLGSAEQYADVLLEMASRLARRCSLGLGLAVVRSSKLGERLAAVYQRGGYGRCAPSKFGRTAAAAAALAALSLIGPAAVAQVAGRAESVAVPDEARAAVAQFRAESNEQAAETTRRLRELQEQTITRLQAVQDELTRSGKLDEAVAVREQIRLLQSRGVAVRTAHTTPVLDAPVTFVAPVPDVPSTDPRPAPLADPGSLTSYHLRLGEQFEFQVTGSADGALWGTDLYTYDSTLAKAAVHAGALAIGQSGVVRVTILKGPPEFHGCSRHGVTSSPWPNASGAYTAFRVERVNDAPTFVILHGRTAPIVLPNSGSGQPNATPGYPVFGTVPGSYAQPTHSYGYAPHPYSKPVDPVPGVPQPATTAAATLLEDIGTMSGFADRRNRIFHIRVAHAAFDGAVWGTDRYTHDSDISSAAIHAGILRPGQTGILGIVVEDGPAYFSGCTRRGVESHDWDNSSGHYAAYRFVAYLVDTVSGGGAAPQAAAAYGYSPGTYQEPTSYNAPTAPNVPIPTYAPGTPYAPGIPSAPPVPSAPSVTPATPAYGRPAYRAPQSPLPTVRASPYPTAPSRPATPSPSSSYTAPSTPTPDTPAPSTTSVAGTRDASPPAAPAPPVEGFIRDVSDDGRVELVLRPNHAVAVGRPLGIWRNAGSDAAGNSQARFLARLRVLEAYDDRAVGQIESESRQATIERGDHVSTSLR